MAKHLIHRNKSRVLLQTPKKAQKPTLEDLQAWDKDRDCRNAPKKLWGTHLAGKEPAEKRTKSWGSGSRFIKRDLVKSRFYGE